ncbi:MAG: hypothetical protein WAT79_14415 [Saprospiraceae bacterium]
MDKLISYGKYLFVIPFAAFGIMHFMNADAMAGMAPGGAVMVYISGLCLILASVSILIGKYDKLASVLLAVLLLLFMIPHYQAMSTDESQLFHILKNLGLAGGALMYSSMAKDNSIIG